MRLAVFTSKYPARVATFFERDMRALVEAGVEIDVFPIYPLDESMWRYAQPILSADVPLCPSLVAVIVADPGAMPVTFPFTSAIATAVLLLDHVTTRPVSAVPLASFGVAVSWRACPASTVADAGLTLTEATGTVQPATVTVAVSERFPGLLVATTLDTPQLALW